MADLGAEVIKIENRRTGGDYARSLGPYFVEGEEGDNASLFFQAVNRNKKSLSLDLGHRDGMRIFHRLIEDADAVANNLRGDVPEKLGLNYETLSSINPAIVCAHCSGYGREGQRKDWPGYDYLMQAEAGYFHLSGEPDTPPTRMGLSVVDFMAGTYLALGLTAAVLGARATGEGRDIDVCLLDAALFNLSYLGAWSLNAPFEPLRLERSAHPSLVPCQLYRTSDGWIYLMCNKEKFWGELCRALGRPDLSEDPRYKTFKERHSRREELTGILDGALSARSTDDWMDAFSGRVPAARVRTPKEALSDPFLAETGRVERLAMSNGASFRVLSSPIKFADQGSNVPAPCLGENTIEILSKLGFSDEEIDEFRKTEVV